MKINLPTFLFILALTLLFFRHDPVQADTENGEKEPIVLDDSTEKVNMDSYIEILVDKEAAYTIEDIDSGRLDDRFKSYQGIGKPNFGYTNSAYWVRLQVENESSLSDWLLEINTPKVNHISLYVPTETGNFKERKMGNAYPFDERDVRHRNLIYNVRIYSGDVQTYYLRFKTGGSMQIPLTMWDATAYNEKIQFGYLLFGVLIGISIVMALYNLFLYFSIGDRSYLYYVLFVVFNGLLFLSDTGLAYQFLWPEMVDWNLRAIVTFMGIGNAFALLFARRFLQTRRMAPKFDAVFKLVITLSFVSAAWSLFSLTFAMYAAILCVLATVILVIPTIIIRLYKNYGDVRFFALAWSVFLFGVLTSILVDTGTIPLIPVTKYAWQVTTVLEIVLLSLALGDKYKTIRKEKEKAELEVKESQEIALENLKRADELKDEFLAITSHELRTPLHGIIGIAETLRDGVAGKVPDVMRSQLWMIITSGKQLAHLVNDILDFSKLKHDDLDIQRTSVNLSDLTEVVLTICQPLVRDKPIKLINHVPSSTMLVWADENRLQQILYNLIGNAIKYTDKGEVTIFTTQRGNDLEINISDTGKGISEEQQASIFNPFQQGEQGLIRDAGGMGIGLSITKRLVELHQGTMEVESKVGRGSTFRFTLPISHAQQKHMGELASTTSPQIALADGTAAPDMLSHNPNTQNEAKVLIADDEQVNLQVLRNHLVLGGYEVIAVSNGEEVMEYMQAHTVDLLILDIMMPRMSGFEVCRRLRERYSLTELPILMLTAKNQVRDIITSFEVGANDYLSKPCDRQELLARVRTLIELTHLSRELTHINHLLEEKVMDRTKELQELNNRLTQVNRDLMQMAESRQILLANISHELGTPVTLIQGFLQALQEGILADEQPRYLKMVFHKVHILNRLISDLSDLSRLEAGNMDLNRKYITIEKWVERMCESLRIMVEGNGRTFRCEKGNTKGFASYLCLMDIERMDQVLYNLVWNAIKHTSSASGTITTGISVQENAGEVVIAIQDNGFGINEEALPFIFERFYKAKKITAENDRGGTGLGLAIAKEIIQAHNGHIWAESKENEGSIFYIALPLQRQDEEGESQ